MAEYTRDLFNRSVSSGWGTADVGGAWTQSLSSATALVGGGVGRFGFTGTGPALASTRTGSVTALDMSCAVKFYVRAPWLVEPATNPGTSVIVRLRATGAVGSSANYYGHVIVRPDGSYGLNLGRHTGTVATVLATTGGPAGTVTADSQWTLEFEAEKANPTKLRTRFWHVQYPPAAEALWLSVHDEAGPQTAGAFEITASRPGPLSTDPFQVLDFESVFASDIPRMYFTYGTSNLYASFDSTGTTGDITAYNWAYGDGNTGFGVTTSHSYAAGGTYFAELQGITRWNAERRWGQYLAVAAPPPAEPPVQPCVRIAGQDMCDLVYSVTWNLGKQRWTDSFGGQTASIRLRGVVPLDQGAKVTIAVPNAPAGQSLWVGIIDQTSEVNEPLLARDDTLVVAMDIASQLSRRHLSWHLILPEAKLPARLDDVLPDLVQTRYKYAGYPVLGDRWPTLKKRPAVDTEGKRTEQLRDRTVLDMVQETLNASLAFGYVGPGGGIVYAPWEAPANLPATPVIDLQEGIDCASRVTLERNAVAGMVNRWTQGSDPYTDLEQAQSIQTYGEQAFSVPSGVYLSDTVGWIPYTVAMVEALDDPARAVTAEVPVTSWDQKVITTQPLNFAEWNNKLYSIMGVRHEVTVGDAWRVTLDLDRNPWEMRGANPP